MKDFLSISWLAANPRAGFPAGMLGGARPVDGGGAVANEVVIAVAGAVGAWSDGITAHSGAAGHGESGDFMRRWMRQAREARSAVRSRGGVRVGMLTEKRAAVGGSGGARAAHWEKGGKVADTGGAALGKGRTAPGGAVLSVQYSVFSIQWGGTFRSQGTEVRSQAIQGQRVVFSLRIAASCSLGGMVRGQGSGVKGQGSGVRPAGHFLPARASLMLFLCGAWNAPVGAGILVGGDGGKLGEGSWPCRAPLGLWVSGWGRVPRPLAWAGFCKAFGLRPRITHHASRITRNEQSSNRARHAPGAEDRPYRAYASHREPDDSPLSLKPETPRDPTNLPSSGAEH